MLRNRRRRARRFATLALVLGTSLSGFLASNPAYAFEVLPACQNEDDTATLCKWDASERGNGLGRDFIVVGSRVIYV